MVGEKNGVTVIDDFAHHPTAIHLTLEGAKDAWPGHRVWAVFEPRSATSRRKTFEESLPESFRLADQTIITDLFAPDKLQAEERLDPKKVVETIRTREARPGSCRRWKRSSIISPNINNRVTW